VSSSASSARGTERVSLAFGRSYDSEPGIRSAKTKLRTTTKPTKGNKDAIL